MSCYNPLQYEKCFLILFIIKFHNLDSCGLWIARLHETSSNMLFTKLQIRVAFDFSEVTKVLRHWIRPSFEYFFLPLFCGLLQYNIPKAFWLSEFVNKKPNCIWKSGLIQNARQSLIVCKTRTVVGVISVPVKSSLLRYNNLFLVGLFLYNYSYLTLFAYFWRILKY